MSRSDEIHNGCDEFAHCLRAISDRNFDKFEIYALRNLLKVPDDVARQLDAVTQLSTPSFTDATVSTEEEEALSAGIKTLQNRILVVRPPRAPLAIL